MKITVCGTVILRVENDSWDPVTDPAVLSQLEGAGSPREEDDEFASYIDDAQLRKIGIQGGFIVLRYDASENTLFVVTEYESPRHLDDDELGKLVEHTTGQWSDGLGESFECSYVSENGLYLDLAPEDQVVTVEQT